MKRLKDITKQMNVLMKNQTQYKEIIVFYDQVIRMIVEKYNLEDNIIILSDIIDIFNDYNIYSQFNPKYNITQLLIEKNQNYKCDMNDNKERILIFTNNIILYCLVYIYIIIIIRN